MYHHNPGSINGHPGTVGITQTHLEWVPGTHLEWVTETHLDLER